MKQVLLFAILISTFSVNAQIGIGTSTPNVSAQVDVNSTTKGFLPPRMTAAQRNTITAPASGLMIYCLNCGSAGEPEYFNGSNWVNMVGAATAAVPVVSAGQAAFGGKIAYLFISTDPGYDANVQHGLVAATADQNVLSTKVTWFNGSNITTGATGTAIGTGLANTDMIITSQGATAINNAAGLARAYTNGGYSDWYLPSKDELNKLYLNKNVIGGFVGDFYWSSSESDYNMAWIQNYNGGNPYQTNKAQPYFVRAVRAF